MPPLVVPEPNWDEIMEEVRGKLLLLRHLDGSVHEELARQFAALQQEAARRKRIAKARYLLWRANEALKDARAKNKRMRS